LRGIKPITGGQIEILLVEETSANDWWAMLRPGKRVRRGSKILLQDRFGKPSAIQATVAGKNVEGHYRLFFAGTTNIRGMLDSIGEVPLPPYISREATTASCDDRERYQTVYARPDGSVAAPTAGLHFTEKLLAEIRYRGVGICFVSLHVGPGTFAPVKTDRLSEHVLHEERFHLDAPAADVINEARRAKRRVIAVGTTTVRVLEGVASSHNGRLAPCEGRTRIFIYPPFQFRVVDALLTNFHLPRSTLLMLVSAFATPGETRGRDLVLSAYAEAIRERYRFYSYGDAMLIL
jgi:S-adenosylmethionine:tRNA ribosyltransferase-isomerase